MKSKKRQADVADLSDHPDIKAWASIDEKMRHRVMRLLTPKRPIGCAYTETPYTRALHVGQAVLHFAAEKARR